MVDCVNIPFMLVRGMLMIETVILGGGCFWCLEALFQKIKGVTQVESGYAGGDIAFPTYEQVCCGDTGHAEVVKVTFDTQQINLHDLLEIFFTIHDPTTLNRQGADIGTQYRSVIYYQTAIQKETAQRVIQEMANVWDASIITELKPRAAYYKAEEEHQNYFNKHPEQGYCALVIAPKINKLPQCFHDRVII